MPGQNPLEQLRPNYLPDPVSWWPPAIGWWLAAILAIVLVSLLVIKVIRHRQNNRYRKQARYRAESLLKHYEQHQDARRFAHDCNRLLKQVALRAYPDREVASLHGRQWQQFLADTGRNPEFLANSGAALGDQRFNPERTLDITALHLLTLSWIRKHHV